MVLDIQFLQECFNFEIKITDKVLSFYIGLPVNLESNLNLLQLSSSLISTQLLSEVHTWLLFLVTLLHKQGDSNQPLGKQLMKTL